MALFSRRSLLDLLWPPFVEPRPAVKATTPSGEIATLPGLMEVEVRHLFGLWKNVVIRTRGEPIHITLESFQRV